MNPPAERIVLPAKIHRSARRVLFGVCCGLLLLSGCDVYTPLETLQPAAMPSETASAGSQIPSLPLPETRRVTDSSPTPVPPLPRSATHSVRSPAAGTVSKGIPTMTPLPIKTRLPSKTATASITPSLTPIPPTPVIPDAAVKIYSPASLSRLISPIQVYAAALAGANGNAILELLGEDGRQLYHEVIHFDVSPGTRVGFERKIPFSIMNVAEDGLLRVFTVDESGRISSLGSSQVVLLSVGEEESFTNLKPREPFLLASPKTNDVLSGGKVEVRGVMSYVTQNPILIELVDANGKILASDLTNQILEGDTYRVPFQSTLSYQIDAPVWVRLILHERDLKRNVDLAVSSLLIKLTP